MTSKLNMRFEVLTVVTIERNDVYSCLSVLLAACSFLTLLTIRPEDGGSMFTETSVTFKIQSCYSREVKSVINRLNMMILRH
jgi:hypothetical protein